MAATQTTKQCPECGSTLNRVSGKDGFPVVPSLDIDTTTGRMTGRVVMQPLKLNSFFACPSCEHVEMGVR
jgi:predicted RNA-binding Zn-ribbon protein involved in translation (DUF1610 family)